MNVHGYDLILRCSRPDGTSYGGFQWPHEGHVIASDWQPSQEHGGLSGWLHGIGRYDDLPAYATDPYAALWQVVTIERGNYLERRNGVVFPSGNVIFSGELAKAVDYVAKRYSGPVMFARRHGLECIVGDAGQAISIDYGIAIAGHHGKATTGNFGLARVGNYGHVEAGYGGIAIGAIATRATAGDEGLAVTGGVAIAGRAGFAYGSYAYAGAQGVAVCGPEGLAAVGVRGVAVGGRKARLEFRLPTGGHVSAVTGLHVDPDTPYAYTTAGFEPVVVKDYARVQNVIMAINARSYSEAILAWRLATSAGQIPSGLTIRRK